MTQDSEEFSIEELVEHDDETNSEANLETKCVTQVNSIYRTMYLSQIENGSHDSRHMVSSTKFKTNFGTKHFPSHDIIIRNPAFQVHSIESMMNMTRNSESMVIFNKINAFLYARMDDEEEDFGTALRISVSKGDNGASGSELPRIPGSDSTATLLEDDDKTKEMPKQEDIWDFEYNVCIKGSGNVCGLEKSLINVLVISDNVQELFVPYVVVLKKKRKPPDKMLQIDEF